MTRFVRRVSDAGESDAALVRRFADERCGEAFAELVRRYGPAVFGVCRRALGDHHLAEDAFQAVFVVLARKAHAVRPPGAVGGWLYGVARKAAAEAAALRRRKCRESLPGTLPETPMPPAEPDAAAAAVEAEIANLPAALRSAVVLCEVEGVSRAEAAARLGIAPGTLSSRLARARKLLRGRLRGLAPAALPAALATAATARADGLATGTVLELSNGVVRTMLLTALKLTPAKLAVVLLVAGAALAGAPVSPRPAAAAVTAHVRPAPVPAKPAWKEQFTLEHTSAVSAVAFGQEMIATFEVNRPEPRPRLWNPADGKAHGTEVGGAWFPDIPARILRFTKDNYLVMVNSYTTGGEPTGAITRYHWRPGAAVGNVLDGTLTLAFSDDLGVLAIRERAKPGQPSRKDRLCLHGNAWEDKKHFLNPTSVLDYPGGKDITHADLSADGRVLVAAGEDSMIRVYGRASLKELRAITLKKDQKLTAVRLSDDGRRLAAVGEGGFAKVYDTDTGAEVYALKGHDGPVAAVAFSPDGKRVATACGRVARVFDAATGKLSGELAGHTDAVTAVAFSPDGKRLVTGSADKTARVWGP